MKSVKSIKNIKGKYVLVRTDFNVPIQNNKIVDDTRIRAALPTLKLLKQKGAKIIIISHSTDETQTFAPIAKHLSKYMKANFVPEIIGAKTMEARAKMKAGDILLLENIRFDRGEKNNDVRFAKELARLADAYVNDAFPVSHRAHASIVGVPTYLPSYAGFQFEREVKELSRVLNPKHPFLFILGGAKIDTKLPLLKRYIKTADTVFVGGVLANNFFKTQGHSIGASKYDADAPSLTALTKNKKLILPNTVVVAEKGGKPRTTATNDVKPNEMILDIGLPSIEALVPIINKSKLILWNGPMGYYEGGYVQATEKLLMMLAKAKGDTIIGGGDTSVLVEKKKLSKKFTFASTAGGATLDFLAKGTLPGIKALK